MKDKEIVLRNVSDKTQRKSEVGEGMGGIVAFTGA